MICTAGGMLTLVCMISLHSRVSRLIGQTVNNLLPSEEATFRDGRCFVGVMVLLGEPTFIITRESKESWLILLITAFRIKVVSAGFRRGVIGGGGRPLSSLGHATQ